ncbi:MAG: type II secretion system major pseudopilin GspG [Thermodesulfobacteriota bacterium]
MALKNRKFCDRGFTLVEILVVMVILGLLAALVGPKLFGHIGKSNTRAAKVQIELFSTALDSFRLEVGRYPTSEEGLGSLVALPDVESWNGPYIRKELPMDSWGNPYIYSSPGEHGDYDIVSLGADESPGGQGESQDVTSWRRID